MFLLDTNIVSDLMKRPDGRVQARVQQERVLIVTSIIVAAEVRFGYARNPSRQLRRQIQTVLDNLPILPFGDGADLAYARVRAGLERLGTPISNNDLLIAAHALALDATLVTDNIREFERVEGLRIENWLRA